MATAIDAPAAAEPRDSHLERAILGAICEDIPPVRTSGMYKLGLATVALAMIVLPLIYLSLIAVAAYGVYWHATNNLSVFQQARAKAAVVAYFGPLVAGGILLFFMIKPLFAPRGARPLQLFLNRKSEPLLFAYIDRLCSAVHAPRPRKICVDCEVNASASFTSGFVSMLGRDLTLTIGLPLAAGMSLRQLSGVLAHEFGHFSQGFGMRLTYIIRSINHWFVRVVYERDAWDEQLVEWSQGGSNGITVIFYLSRFVVWLTRRVLWVLMHLGNLISCFMLRQMEFDADRYEARLAGCDVFESTSRRLLELSIANQMAMADLQQFFRDGRLADNLPQLTVANVAQITPELRQSLEKHAAEEKTGLFDTHPATRDRIISSKREQTPGVFRLSARVGQRTHPTGAARVKAARNEGAAGSLPGGGEGDADLPASVLFSRFEKLCKAVTRAFYEDRLEREVRPEELSPVATLVSQQGAQVEAIKALQRYFQGQFTIARPLPVPADIGSAPQDESAETQRLEAARERLLAMVDAYRKTSGAADDLDTRILQALQASVLLHVGIKFKPQEFQLDVAKAAAAEAALQASRAALSDLEPELAAFEKNAARRLFIAVRMLHASGVQDQLPEAGTLLADATALTSVGRLTSHVFRGPMLALRNLRSEMACLCGRVEANPEHSGLRTTILSKMEEIQESLVALKSSLGDQPYPFPHASGDMTIADFVVPVIPAKDDLGEVVQAVEHAFDNLCGLHIRAFARLAQIAEQVEQQLGLPPFPEPVDVPAG